MSKQKNIEELSLGAKKRPYDKRDYRLAGIVETLPMPEEYEVDDKFPVKNQFSRGSCTAQSYTGCKEDDENIPLSARFAMANTKKLEGNLNYGAYTFNQFLVGIKTGTCEEALFPEPEPTMTWVEYNNMEAISSDLFNNALQHKTQSAWVVENSVSGFKNALYQYKKAIAMSMNWLNIFNNQNVKNGMLPTNLSGSYSVGGHAVKVIGWSDRKLCPDNSFGAFRVKNSWGNGWGDEGYFWLPYSIFDRVVWEGDMMLDMPKKMPVDDRYGITRTWTSFLQEQYQAFKNTWLRGKIGRLPSNREISGLVYGRWDYESVFKGRCGEIWLSYTKTQAREKKLINY